MSVRTRRIFEICTARTTVYRCGYRISRFVPRIYLSNGQYISESLALSPRRNGRARGHVPAVALHDKLFLRFGPQRCLPWSFTPARHFFRFRSSWSPADNLLIDVIDRLARHFSPERHAVSSPVVKWHDHFPRGCPGTCHGSVRHAEPSAAQW